MIRQNQGQKLHARLRKHGDAASGWRNPSPTSGSARGERPQPRAQGEGPRSPQSPFPAAPAGTPLASPAATACVRRAAATLRSGCHSHCGSAEPGPSNFAKLTAQAEIFRACSLH